MKSALKYFLCVMVFFVIAIWLYYQDRVLVFIICALGIAIAYFYRPRVSRQSRDGGTIKEYLKDDVKASRMGFIIVILSFLWALITSFLFFESGLWSIYIFIAMFLSGWVILLIFSQGFRESGWRNLSIGIALLTAAPIWIILFADFLDSESERHFSIVMRPAMSFIFSGVILIITPIIVRLVRISEYYSNSEYK